MAVRDRPTLTRLYERVEDFVPLPGSAYILGTSVEQRSEHSTEWVARAGDTTFVRIIAQRSHEFDVDLRGIRRVGLRSGEQLSRLVREIGRPRVYLDITGLGHHIWAPLLRALLSTSAEVLAVYVEPSEYRFSKTPTEGEIFDLSEAIAGIAPLPGFAALTDSDNDNVCFVALLGFEGTRFAYVLETVQPPGGKVIPVVGVPGFRPEYPFHAYQGNRSALLETRSWRNVRFATANCPFSAVYVLQDIAAAYSGNRLKIAPIGTKPHALGAILFALSNPDPVELVYDHPVRAARRTSGAARLLVYHLSAFARPSLP